MLKAYIMDINQKIIILFGICLILCLGAYIIISNLFDNIETQLIERYRVEAKLGARGSSELMNFMIDTNILSEKALFDREYKVIPGTKPAMYTTKYDQLFEKYIQDFQDEFLRVDKDLVYSAVVDINGYAPTHNSNYSQPPRKDMQYNLRYSRAKRKFDDTVGLRAARYIGTGTLEQLYTRDTGEIIWDIAAPVKLKGKHWGAFRVGVSMGSIQELKNHMLLTIVLSIFIIISITLLMIFLIIPKKLVDTDIITTKY